MKRHLFNLLTGFSLLLFLATVVMWIRSYWRSDLSNWTRDSEGNGHYVLLRYSESSLRGGAAFYFQYTDANGTDSTKMLQDYFDWHPHGFELSSDPVAKVDAGNKNPWRTSYLFKPTSPTTLGFQFGSRRGLYDGSNQYSTAILAMPYWFPGCTFAILPIGWLLIRIKRRRRRLAGICISCGYDLRATPNRCPECGSISATVKRNFPNAV